VDAVISDNRYGFCSSSVKSIFITHQLAVKTGAGRSTDGVVNKMLRRYIEQFSECWVPDFSNEPIAAGLSRATVMPKIPVQYLGCLSRFEPCSADVEKGFILIILSGPEPQRSILEKLVLNQLPLEGYRMLLVRGQPNAGSGIRSVNGIEIADHLQATQLNELICKAELIISRSGYTTIMDLLKLKKKMILIPTPGQKEQEHLAEHLQRKKLALCYQHENFSLRNALRNAEEFEFAHIDVDMDEYKNVLAKFVNEFT
jgi:uncharacterized protein (TIGR00661 family)